MSEYRFMSLSGRPRPVTATVTKPRWTDLNDHSPTRRLSLDSTGSTASLCSVLDHDSYISLSSEEGEQEVESDMEETQEQFSDMNLEEGPLESYKEESTGTEISEYKMEKKPQENVYSPYARSKSANITPKRKTNRDDDSPELKGLSPWEKWLLIKTKEQRIKHKEEMRAKKKEEEEKLEEERKKKQKQMKAEEEIKRWKKIKEEEKRAHKRLEKRIKESEEDCKNKEEALIHEKAEKKYDEWLKTKKFEEKKKRKEEKLQKLKEKELETERRKKAEEKFREWCKNAKKRPKSAGNTSHSYITDTNEANAYPEPAFCNPIPWQPIKIPRQKSEVKKNGNKNKKSSKPYVWNPAKYY